jgi:predicted nucleotidyltransferase component of viral defense system
VSDQNANVAQSVRQRLLNLARQTGQDYNRLLVRYSLERILYRLSQSEHADRFILKGAMLFAVWSGQQSR